MQAETTEGLCPRCLMSLNFDSRTMPDGEAAAKSPPLSIEEIRERFPQFEILECLGRGGMGVVYKARQKALDREVAIKVLAGEWDGEEDFASRFEKEAKTLAQMSHPNIVTVHDFGETEGLYYIVMEFVDGVNLRDIIQDGKMDPAQALKIVPPVCEALQYAHEKGIVHRDIKPENLLIDRDGRVKIADFGIASLIGANDENSGTPPYMAPEQGTHSGVDHRADIYALGVVLYEMLTGERPESPLDLPSQKVQLDIRIDDIVLRALSKEPERRYRTANEFRTVVENVTPEKSPSPVEAKQNVPTMTKPLDPRIGQGIAIAIIIAGVLNGVSTLASLLILPFLRRYADLETNQSFAPFLPPPGMSGSPFMVGSIAGVVIVLSIIFTIIVSTLCILGGRHMYRGTSRPWAITGAIACCLTPLFWPLGLILGVGAVILLLIDNSPAVSSNPIAPPQDQGPRVSVMAVVAALLVTLPFLGLLILSVFVA